ncbi:MAG: hypothetical protein AAF409_03570 [Pseudomonadota bacterium]
MRKTLDRFRKSLEGAVEAAWDQLPEFTLSSDVEVPIFVIHHGPTAEDYEIVCDFQQFMTVNQSGFLSRPSLRIWAGRDDFARHTFARHLREAFSAQFEALRDEHRAERERRRWALPGVGDVILWGLSLTGGVLGSLLLLVATETGRTALDRIGAIVRGTGIGRLTRSSSPEQELEALIEEKKGVIDAGLARLDVALHRELYTYAWRDQRPGPMTGMKRDAWPLPDFVRDRMHD